MTKILNKAKDKDEIKYRWNNILEELDRFGWNTCWSKLRLFTTI